MSYQLNERVLQIREKLNLSQTEFGKSLGVSRGVISNIDLNIVDVETKPLLLQQICKVYNVDPYWLETGEGDMFLEKDDLTSLVDFAVSMFEDESLEWIRRLCEAVNSLSPEERADVAKYAKMLAKAIAGENKKEQE